MADAIDQAALVQLVRSIPRGKVTTYELLASALGAPRDQIAELLHAACRETVTLLMRGAPIHDTVLPCWRIIDERQNGILSPTEDPLAPEDPLYRIVIQPLLDEGIPVAPPTYEILPEYLHRPG